MAAAKGNADNVYTAESFETLRQVTEEARQRVKNAENRAAMLQAHYALACLLTHTAGGIWVD